MNPVFIYSWHVEDDEIEDENHFVIRGFGVTAENKNVMIDINRHNNHYLLIKKNVNDLKTPADVKL